MAAHARAGHRQIARPETVPHLCGRRGASLRYPFSTDPLLPRTSSQESVLVEPLGFQVPHRNEHTRQTLWSEVAAESEGAQAAAMGGAPGGQSSWRLARNPCGPGGLV